MTRKLWQFPWGFPESVLFVAGLAITGFLLQLSVGHFNFAILRAPANFIALALLTGSIALGVWFRDSMLIRWIAGIPLAITLIAALLILGLYMELTPQLSRLPEQQSLVSRLGFTMMTSSWPFALLYTMTLVALGIATANRLLRVSRRDFAFLCNHLGLWVLLASGGLGAADLQRFVMNVNEGETQWQVFKDEKTLELPIAITLKKFTLEEYPPKLTIIDRQTGDPQPQGKPEYLQIDTQRPEGRLGDWTLTLDEYLHEAVRIDGQYRTSPMPASTPAAKVTVRHLQSGETRTGWVSSGGKVPAFSSSLALGEQYTLVMTVPEPKRFASDINVMTEEGGPPIEATLEVNKPVTTGNWMIYQYGYDTAAGKMSSYSAIELVYDPWLLPAKGGMALMALGALLLVWNGAGRRSHAQ